MHLPASPLERVLRVLSGCLVLLLAGARPLVAQAVPAPSAAGDQRPVQLTPFEVITERNDGYDATNTNSVTGLRTELKNVPITAMILNQQMYDDLAVISPVDMLREYVPGVGPPFRNSGESVEGGLAGDNYGPNNFKIRGLSAGIPRVDGVLEAGTATVDNFYLDRTEIIRGPQSLLYGSASASGLINVVPKQATFGRNTRKAVARFDSEGSVRGEFDFNQTLWKDTLAVRVAAMRERRKFWRDNLRDEARGLYGQVAYKPVSWATLRLLGNTVRQNSTQSIGGVQLVDPSDPSRNNQRLSLLLAQGRAQGILNNKLSWENVDSLYGDYRTRGRHVDSWLGTLDLRLPFGLNARIAFGDIDWDDHGDLIRSQQGLLAPTVPRNPTGKWAVGGYPGSSAALTEFGEAARILRGIVTSDFELFSGRWRTKNQLTFGAEQKKRSNNFTALEFYLVDANGNFVVNPAQVTNANAGRTLPPVVYWSIEESLKGPFTPGMSQWTHDGRTYKPAPRRVEFAAPATPNNPNGLINPGGGYNRNRYDEQSAFASWSGDLLDGRLRTLAGVRYNDYETAENLDGTREADSAVSWNVGGVYHLTSQLGLYAGYSESWAPNTQGGGLYPSTAPIPTQLGIGYEAGVKFDLPRWRMSGSVAAYKVENTNEIGRLGSVYGIIDPNGINGRGPFDESGGTNPAYIMNRRVHGIELTMTARPTDQWRLHAAYSFSGATGSTGVKLPMLYNDEFRTNAAGGVLFDNGSPALVRSVPTDPNSPMVQLTTAMMRDPASPHYANLDPQNGRIINLRSGSLEAQGLVNNADGRTIGTGRSGLPISAHQLGYVSPVGAEFEVQRPGQKTGQYPEHAVSTTTSYTFKGGLLDGFNIGGNLAYSWKQLGYYYFVPAQGAYRLLMYPDKFAANLMLGKSFKFGRDYRLRMQLNVQNLFDKQQVIFQPSQTTGQLVTARLDNNPRLFVLTNSIEF